MRLSNRLACVGVLVSSIAFAQLPAANANPVPTDIPYSIAVQSTLIMDDKEMLWSADGGIYINEQGREQISTAIHSLQDSNDKLTAAIKQANDELASEQDAKSTYTYISVAASIVTTIATAVAVAFAAKK